MRRLTALTFTAVTLLLMAATAFYTHELTLAGVEARLTSANDRLQMCQKIVMGGE